MQGASQAARRAGGRGGAGGAGGAARRHLDGQRSLLLEFGAVGGVLDDERSSPQARRLQFLLFGEPRAVDLCHSLLLLVSVPSAAEAEPLAQAR